MTRYTTAAVLTVLAVAGWSWAAGNRFYMGGMLVSNNLRVIDGRAYVPIVDLARALDASISERTDGYDLIAARTANQPPYQVLLLEAGDRRDGSTRDIMRVTSDFTTDTKRIFVNAGITGLTKGDTITGTLMAVDVITASGARVWDTEVASADVEAPGEESTANFDFTAPTKGWPTGSYVVHVFVNGERVDSIELTISKPEQQP